MTAEVAFAKTFLSVLDAKPVKLQSDYAVDARTLEITVPYILPRQGQPMTKPTDRSTSTSAPGSERSINVTLKSLRNPPLELSLSQQSRQTSVLDLKGRVAQELGLQGTDKVRLLYNKKPCSDSKSIKDVLGDEGDGAANVEFSVMVIGGAPAPASTKGTDATGAGADVEMRDANGDTPVAPEQESGIAVLARNEFWADLKGFLEQRVKDQATADKAVTIFQAAWKERSEFS